MADMLTRLGLRLRIFLFFGLIAIGAAILAGGALWLGWARAEEAVPLSPFVTAFVVFVFVNTGFVLGIWLLFDENIAKPINALSANLRLRAHSGVDTPMDAEGARYLGDLAPAADALTKTAQASILETAAKIAHETQRLRQETDRLTALLTESPVATILLNPVGEIVLYDAQAASILSGIAPPRLKAPISDYFNPDDLQSARAQLNHDRQEVAFDLHDRGGQGPHKARLKALGEDGHMVFIDVATGPAITPRPLVFDFDLMQRADTQAVADTPLDDLCFVAFDTETTGLSVDKDAIVQLGAVRILNGRIIEGEVMDCYVNPGRPIPPASTRIHHVTDADVADAPAIEPVGRSFHQFARDAVLVAHNAPFDIGLLRRFEGEMGVEWSHPVLDTVLLSAVVFGTTSDHSLDALCDRLSVEIPPALRHTALGDAQATAGALVRLLPLLQARGFKTFGQLVAETQKHGRLLQDLN